MCKSIVSLVLAGLFYFNVYASEPDIPPEDVNICDCNCICKPPEPLPVAYLFEDFNNVFDLNWTILKNDSSHWSLKMYPGSLTIRTQSGSFEYTYTNYKNVFLVDFPVSQTLDFQITTCIKNFEPRGIWNQAGLLLWNDEDNYLKFVYEYGEETPKGDGLLFTVGQQISGGSSYAWFLTEQTPQTMWLRIIKRGEVYELYNSTDGKSFLPIKVYRGNSGNVFPCLSVPIKNIGIFASNGTATNASEVDASFEFFEFKTLPPLPKDPNEE